MTSIEGINGILNAMSQSVAPALLSALEDATEARQLIEVYEAESDPVGMHYQLVNNRRQIERLEFLTGKLVLLKSRAQQQVASAKARYEDAYITAATKPNVKVGFGEFATAKEKDAAFNLSTVAETLEVRKSEALLRDVESTWDYCRILLRGAEGVQRDMELRVRLLSLQSQLER